MRADAANASGGSAVLSSTIGRCLSMLDGGTRAWLEKSDMCFVMAKQTTVVWEIFTRKIFRLLIFNVV